MSREWHGGPQGLGEGKLLFNRYKVPITQIKEVLEICCAAVPIIKDTVLCTSKCIERVLFMLSVLAMIKINSKVTISWFSQNSSWTPF